MTKAYRKTNDGVLILKPKFDCKHNRYLVDPKLAHVECALCGEKLNPMWVLNELCNQEAMAYHRMKELSVIAKKAEEKNRCKCEHCGKMTRICK